MAKSDNLSVVLKLLVEGQKLTATDTDLQDRLETSERNVQRYLKELSNNYDEIVTEVIDRKTYYKIIKVSDIVNNFLSTSNDMSWLIQLMAESDKRIFSELEEESKERLEKILSSEKDIFLYQNSPFEVFEDAEHKKIFRDLKRAVQNNEYRDIDYEYNNFKPFTAVKCLKLIFMENNWYVAIGTEEDFVIFLRISFIKEVRYSDKASYQPTQLNRYKEFFETIQNPMTLFGVKKEKAHILVVAKDAKYFKPNMKKLLTSQNFIRKNEDGTVEFTVEYTQSLEVLPFIKKWLPSLKILSPKSLRDELRADLDAY